MSDSRESDIALIGMAGRFPGSRNLEQFWENLRTGTESIAFFSEEELRAFGVNPALLADPKYVRAKGMLEDVDLFDAAFFGYSPREAELIDPQQRVFLECAREALDHAGYDTLRYDRPIGLFAGSSISSYLLVNLYSNFLLGDGSNTLQVFSGNDKDFLATRTSYKLHLTGPSLSVQTACSTSLVAVHLACQSLLSGESDMALAGGVSISFPVKSGYLFREGGILSPDGHCRTFDAQAQGTVLGNGVGVVLLKRLADALADGDCIHAVIKGSAINNDGARKMGYTAPSIEGQVHVISEALALADVEPESVGYIECHGTATPLGDPIELAALTQVFRESTSKRGFCAVGSVKSNVGHLDAAAGVAGLIKAVLALKHRVLPPSLHFQQPNPAIDFASGPFFVSAQAAEWKAPEGHPRRAGVSSFGIGGTNAHVVLEEAPAAESSAASRPWHLLMLSARTPSALDAATRDVASALSRAPRDSLADVAFTLAVGRQELPYRRVLVCQEAPEAMAALEALDPERVLQQHAELKDRPVAFLFPGQGAQYAGMGQGLYQTEPVFREHVDRCAELLKPRLGLDLREVLFPSEAQAEEANRRLSKTSLTQAALFVTEYALARLWMSWGVIPQAMLGHSIGEYVAACLAEVFSLEEALGLVAARGKLMEGVPTGAMLACALSEEDVRTLLGTWLSLAAVNGPAECVVAGPVEAIQELESRLSEREVNHQRLLTSHAFHSAMMEPILRPFTEEVRRVRLRPPRLRYLSNISGTWITAEEATDPGYWARHLRGTVRFAEGVAELVAQPHQALIEVGPGRALGAMVRRRAGASRQSVVSAMRSFRDRQPDFSVLLQALGRLWLAGVKVDWQAYFAHEQRRRVPLPAYPFERQRYWVEPRALVREASASLPQTVEGEPSRDSSAVVAVAAPLSSSLHPRPGLPNVYVEPRNEFEQRIAGVWQEVLGIAPIGAHDDFFELGGHSLLATQIVHRLREQFPVELPIRSLLVDAPTVARLADAIEKLLVEKLEAMGDDEAQKLL